MKNQTCVSSLISVLVLCATAAAQTPAVPADFRFRLPRPDLSKYHKSAPLQISGDGDHVIEGQVFAPTKGNYGIRIDNHFRGKITIRNCVFVGPHGAAVDGLDPGNGGGILAWQSSNLLIDPGIAGININGGLHAGILDNAILMSANYRTSLSDGPVKNHPAWAAITLFNYSGGISRDSGHEVRGNRVAFRGPGPAPFVNQTKPLDTVVEGNDWDAELDWDRLIRERLANEEPLGDSGGQNE